MKRENRYLEVIEKLGRINEAKRRGLISELEALEAERYEYMRLRLNDNAAGLKGVNMIDERIDKVKAAQEIENQKTREYIAEKEESSKMDQLVEAAISIDLFNPKNDSDFLNQSDCGRYILKDTKNNWDMNYHLYDTDKDIEYLLDTDIVIDPDHPDDGGVFFWEDFIGLYDIGIMIEMSWKALKG